MYPFAPDSCDSGKSPESPSDRIANLRDEVAFLEPVLTRAGSPLVAWGGSIDFREGDAEELSLPDASFGRNRTTDTRTFSPLPKTN